MSSGFCPAQASQRFDLRGRAFAEQYGISRAADSVDELSASDIDAVYISTTNEKHHAQALTTVGVDKQMLCEKPPVLSVADARELAVATAVKRAAAHGSQSITAMRSLSRAPRVHFYQAQFHSEGIMFKPPVKITGGNCWHQRSMDFAVADQRPFDRANRHVADRFSSHTSGIR